jgi:hypothetical protein
MVFMSATSLAGLTNLARSNCSGDSAGEIKKRRLRKGVRINLTLRVLRFGESGNDNGFHVGVFRGSRSAQPGFSPARIPA